MPGYDIYLVLNTKYKIKPTAAGRRYFCLLWRHSAHADYILYQVLHTGTWHACLRLLAGTCSCTWYLVGHHKYVHVLFIVNTGRLYSHEHESFC